MKSILLLISLLFPLLSFASCPVWTESEVSKQLEELRQEVKYHDDLYYNKHAPVLSDSEYDDLKAQLSYLEDCFPNLAVTYDPVADQGGKIDHKAFMGSLDKANDEKDIIAFLKKADKSLVLVQPKIDGVAAELVYQEGKLVAASTRGTGDRGMDILKAIMLMPSVPKKIPTEQAEIVLHGELFARMDIGVDYSGYASARHYVAGHLARDDADVLAMANIAFFPWRWVNSPFSTDNAVLNGLYSLGFDLPTMYTMVAKSLKDVKKIRQDFYHNRKNEPFLMDGIVLKLDNLKLRNELGWSSNHPNWALAWKFAAGNGVSQVTAIDFTIGRTGQITPVLEISPTKIRGEIIQKISMGSVRLLQKKNIAVGDRITVVLKGNATPVFGKVVNRPKGRVKTELPDSSRYDAYSCLKWSKECDQQFLARLKWFVKQLSLPGLDEPTLKALINDGSIRSFDQITSLSVTHLIRAGLNKDQAIQTANSLESLHKKSFKVQLISLSIPGIGKKRAERLALVYKNWGSLFRSTNEDIQQLKKYLDLPEIKAIIIAFEKPS